MIFRLVVVGWVRVVPFVRVVLSWMRVVVDVRKGVGRGGGENSRDRRRASVDEMLLRDESESYSKSS